MDGSAGNAVAACSMGAGAMSESAKSKPRIDCKPKVIVRAQLEQSINCMTAEPWIRSEKVEHPEQPRALAMESGERIVAGICGVRKDFTKTWFVPS